MTNTLYGFEKYYNIKEQSLFDDIILPEGVDKTVLVNTIIVESGEFEVIYPNGDFLKIAIQTWFKRKYPMIERWVKAINTDYKPLDNYNKTEEWTEINSGGKKNTANKSTKYNNESDTTDKTNLTSTGSRNTRGEASGTSKTSDTNNYKNSSTIEKSDKQVTDSNSTESDVFGKQTSVSESKVSAFNSSTYSPSSQDTKNIESKTDTKTLNSDATVTVTGTETNNGTLDETKKSDVTTTGNNSESESTKGQATENRTSGTTISGSATTSDESSNTHNDTSKHTGHMYGNIGVTTSQQMLQSELKLWGRIDIYKDTADLFIQDFCIMLY